MTSRIKKRRDDPPQPPISKRRRGTFTSSSDPESSESELSDLNEELEEETMNTLISGATQGRAPVQDDDDDNDDDSSEASSDEDTPEEREEEYVYEDDKDISEDLSPAPKKLPIKPAPRASGRRKSASRAKMGPSNLSSVSRPDDTPMKDSITISRRAPKNRSARPEQTIKLTLKMTKDKLREATASWTPPPGAAEPGIDESSSAEDAVPARAGRGRKTVDEEESDDDADEDADGEEVDEDEDAEGEDEDDGLNDEDAEGETDDEEMIDSEDDDDTGVNSPDFRSRTGTPDMSRLTKRQKSRLDEVYSADLLELPTGIERPGAAKAIPLTADEQALKRAEMARRRKNLTDQRLEEEKIDTINKLLKKQTPKMRNKGQNTGVATPADIELAAADSFPVPKMVRWVSNKDGIRVGVPEAWLAGPVGRVFLQQGETERMKAARGRMVEEVVPMEIEA